MRRDDFLKIAALLPFGFKGFMFRTPRNGVAHEGDVSSVGDFTDITICGVDEQGRTVQETIRVRGTVPITSRFVRIPTIEVKGIP